MTRTPADVQVDLVRTLSAIICIIRRALLSILQFAHGARRKSDSNHNRKRHTECASYIDQASRRNVPAWTNTCPTGRLSAAECRLAARLERRAPNMEADAGSIGHA